MIESSVLTLFEQHEAWGFRIELYQTVSHEDWHLPAVMVLYDRDSGAKPTYFGFDDLLQAITCFYHCRRVVRPSDWNVRLHQDLSMVQFGPITGSVWFMAETGHSSNGKA